MLTMIVRHAAVAVLSTSCLAATAGEWRVTLLDARGPGDARRAEAEVAVAIADNAPPDSK